MPFIICVSGLAPGHYLNQRWLIVYWTITDKLQWNLNLNTKFWYIIMQSKCEKWRPFFSKGDAPGKLCYHIRVQWYQRRFYVSKGDSGSFKTSKRSLVYIWFSNFYFPLYVLIVFAITTGSVAPKDNAVHLPFAYNNKWPELDVDIIAFSHVVALFFPSI